MTASPLLLIYAVPLVLLWAGLTAKGRARSRRAQAVLDDNVQAGLDMPSSLHPVIDPARCLGCGSCVRACPEKTILGIIDGKAALIEPTLCVGHGACQSACPTDAISLVFGTATRGVDIPVLTPQFETSVPGIFIAGELGGMGLIKNAIEQGRQAMDAVARYAKARPSEGDMLDTLIVGCGPAGISASLGAMAHKLRFVTLEQSTLGGTVAHYPRGKLVMTAPATLPLVGKMRFGEVRKETLLAYWEDVLRQTGLAPQFEEQVISITTHGDLFEVVTSKAHYRARTVVLAIGRRGTPRPLGVPGEELEKVVYRLIDAEQYAGKRMMVVGGGDSALEAAASLAEQAGTQVILSYRGGAFARARAKNRDRVASLVASGALDLRMESQILAITPTEVEMTQGDQRHRLANDYVVICAGGLLPTQFLLDTGIRVEAKFGTA